MKTFKYLFVGALMFGSSTVTVLAQTPNYKSLLEPIQNELKAQPGDANAAKDLIKNYTKMFKKDPQALVELGNVFLSNKRLDQAGMLADMAIKKDKNYGDAYILKGDIGAIQDNGGEAAMWYQQAMRMDPKNPYGYMRYANVNRKVSPEETDRALKELRQNVPDFPMEAEAGHSYYAMGSYDKAMEYFSQSNAEKIDENYLVEYALTAVYNQQQEEGLKIAKIGMRRFPENVSFLRLALINTIGIQKYDEAVQYGQQLIQKNGNNKNAGDITYYGQALAGSHQYAEAIQQYEEALKLDAKNFRPYQLISEAYMGMGDEDNALQYTQKYLSLDPNAKLSDYTKLAEIYMAKVKKGEDKEANFGKAIKVYEDLAAKFPQIASWAHLQQANSAFMAEMDDKALPYYQQIISELENKADKESDELGYLATAYKNAGYIYWSSKNDLETATPYFEKLLKIDPDNKLAKKALGLEEETAPAQ